LLRIAGAIKMYGKSMGVVIISIGLLNLPNDQGVKIDILH